MTMDDTKCVMDEEDMSIVMVKKMKALVDSLEKSEL
jgi:hypothetical protein